MLATIKQEKVQLQFISQDFLALLSTKSTALGEPFPRPDRLGIIDMWGMTKNYTCRTGWKLGREPVLPSQSTLCQMASSNSTHSRDIALPVLLRAGGKKSHKDHLAWLLFQHNPWSFIQQLLCWTGVGRVAHVPHKCLSQLCT